MGLPPFQYAHSSQWITEGAEWRPPDAITLRDAAGAVIGSTAMTDMRLTLYNPTPPTYDIVAGVENMDIKNTRSCTISSQGIFILTLLSTDTIAVDMTKNPEQRVALVQYTWASGTKSDAIEFFVFIRHVVRHPYVAP